MRHYKIAVFVQVSVAALFLPAAGPTVAQDAGADDGTIEEIIVTSRKMGAENLQDIPASISAMDSDTLREMMVVDFEDFARQIPGLTFIDTSPGEKRYVIRGIQSAGQQQVAVYYDEVPLPGVQSSTSDSGGQTTDLKLYDMQRVEVLRGPQGTVFGANSQGGTVRFITVQPVLGEMSGYGAAELSRTDHASDNNWNFQAIANIPIGENFAARVLVYDGKDAGYIDNTRCRATNPAEDPRDPNTALSCLDQQDYNWAETTGLRANLLWEPSESTTIKGQFWWQDRQTGGDSRYHPYDAYNDDPTDPVYVGGGDSVAGFTWFQEGRFKSGDYALTRKPDEQTIYSLTGEFELPFADLTATASHYERNFDFKFDSTWIITFLLQDDLEAGLPACSEPDADPDNCLRADLLYALTDQTQDLAQEAFEFSLNSQASDSPIQWVDGGFYRKRDSNFQSFVPVIGVDGVVIDNTVPPTLPPGNEIGAGVPGCNPCVFARTDSKEIRELAFFGELNWAITDSLDLNVGARWFDVDQTETGSLLFDFAAFAPNPSVPNSPTGALGPDVDKLSDSETPWKVALGWHVTENIHLYGLRANGFRLGGTNNRGIGEIEIPEQFEADELVNWEFGVKSQLADNRVTLNAAAFFMEWDNMQVAGMDITEAFGFIGNAGKSEVNGIEVELYAAVTDSFFLTGQFSYLYKKELTEDQISDDVLAPGKKGDQCPQIPECLASVTAQDNYTLSVDDWFGAVRLEGSYTGDSFTELRPDAAANRFQDSYSLFNLRFNFANDPMDLIMTLYIENIFDKRGDVFIGGGAQGQPTSKITNRPRTVGVQVTKGFGRG